jgi:hypothetical protein
MCSLCMVCSKLPLIIGTVVDFKTMDKRLVLEGHQINHNNHLLSSGIAGGKLEATAYPFTRLFFF